MTDLSHTNAPAQTQLEISAPSPQAGPFYVRARISAPEFVDWHMILDQELEQLSRPETGLIASLGFMGLGAAIGLLVPLIGVVEKIGVVAQPGKPAPPPVSISDIACVASFTGSLVLGIVCLAIAGIAWMRNKGLATAIRRRTRRGVGASAMPENAHEAAG
jgi:hypothetical protein